MPRFSQLLLISFALIGQHALAQSKPDSVTHRYDSLAKVKLQSIDSSSQKFNKKIDATQQKVNSIFNPNLNQLTSKAKPEFAKAKHNHDSVLFYKQLDKEKERVLRKKEEAERKGLSDSIYVKQLDSLNKVTYKPDSVSSITKSKQRLLTNKQELSHSGDSLAHVNLSTGKLTNRTDSLTQKPIGKINEAESTIKQVEQKLNAPANKVEGAINDKLNLMKQEGGAGANLPGNVNSSNGQLNTDLGLTNNVNLPSADLKANNPLSEINNPLNQQMGGVGEVKDKVTELKSVPQEQINKVKSIEEVQNVQGKLGEANNITDKAQAYGKDVQSIASGNLNEVKEAPKALEQQAAKMGGVQDLQKEAGAFNQYKDLAAKGNDPEALKAEAMKESTKMLSVDHFAGQQEVLKSAMDKVSKLKSKYSKLNSLSEIPKRKPNQMKGKPLIERIVPGITIQLQKTNNVLLDYNPQVGYRFYGKFMAGVGWNERISVGRHAHISLKDRIYGPRAFAEFKIGRGFTARADIEKMNTNIPSITAYGLLGDHDHRAWVWSAFIGLKREYKFMKGVRGNAQFLYNLYDDHNNSPYADRFVVRMGFEFPMRRKV